MAAVARATFTPSEEKYSPTGTPTLRQGQRLRRGLGQVPWEQGSEAGAGATLLPPASPWPPHPRMPTPGHGLQRGACWRLAAWSSGATAGRAWVAASPSEVSDAVVTAQGTFQKQHACCVLSTWLRAAQKPQGRAHPRPSLGAASVWASCPPPAVLQATAHLPGQVPDALQASAQQPCCRPGREGEPKALSEQSPRDSVEVRGQAQARLLPGQPRAAGVPRGPTCWGDPQHLLQSPRRPTALEAGKEVAGQSCGGTGARRRAGPGPHSPPSRCPALQVCALRSEGHSSTGTWGIQRGAEGAGGGALLPSRPCPQLSPACAGPHQHLSPAP